MTHKKSLIGIFTFSAVILGALSATNTVKADSTTDNKPSTTTETVSPATTSTASSSTVQTSSANTNKIISTQPVYNALPTASTTSSTSTNDSSNVSEENVNAATGNAATETNPGTSDSSDLENNNYYSNGSNTATVNTNNTQNTNGGKWTGNITYSRPQDNFYMYENGAWVSSAKVNNAITSAGTFDDVTAQIAQKVQKEFMDYQSGMDDSAGLAMNEATWFYQLTSHRNLSSPAVVTPDMIDEINWILGFKNINDLNAQYTNMIARDIPTPFQIVINRDQTDPTKKALYFLGGQPLLLLKDGKSIDADQENTIVKFLQSAGVDSNLIQTIINGTASYDSLLLHNMSSTDLNADPTNNANYAQVNFQALANMSPYINFNGITQTLTRTTPDNIYEMTPTYFNNLNKLINPQTLNNLKLWLVSNLILYRAGEMQDVVGGFLSFLQSTNPRLAQQYVSSSGGLSQPLQQQAAYYLTTLAFGDAMSQYYGPQLITSAEKTAVTSMTKKIISAYADKINSANWLEPSTKQAAINKLNNIVIKVGAPTKQDFAYYNLVDIEGFNSPYINFRNLVGAKALQGFLDFTKPVDRAAWESGDSALAPNASYDRMTNSITINAAIIQSPFFSLKNTDSQNFGGLGVIIGHELSHGFDSTGSLYDGNGELVNWWTATDRARYNTMVNKMIKEFDGIKYAGGKVNGTLTRNENMADNGGLNVALAALKKFSRNYDLKQFFTNYALGWRSKYNLDMQASQLTDVHTPDSIRVNTSLQNIPDFYSTYNVRPTDGMYLAPDKRVNMW